MVQVVRTADRKAMQTFLKECIIQRNGWMRRLTTDQGTPFRSRLSQDFKKYWIEHRITTFRHQQADGLAERANIQHLEPLAKQKYWPDLLQGHVKAYNMSKHASTGYEPFYLMHGFHTETAVEIVLPMPIAITGDEPVEESRDQALKNVRRKLMTCGTRM